MGKIINAIENKFLILKFWNFQELAFVNDKMGGHPIYNYFVNLNDKCRNKFFGCFLFCDFYL